jgi:multicomponent Na+:H+ antiporter subunit B
MNPDLVAPDFIADVSAVNFIDVSLLVFMGMVAIAIIRMRSLFAIAMLSGVYSLLSALWFTAMDAVDVAFTEAAVGAGISTTLILGAMLLTTRTAKPDNPGRYWTAMVVVLATGAVLFYASLDLPAFGDPNSPVNAYVGLEYLKSHGSDIGAPNVVTGVLASYRGFDTLGEAAVVYVAGLCVVLLLGFGERSLAYRRRKRPKPAQPTPKDEAGDD